jgi:DNA repair exonuclease SbcCD ATPase subunit
MLDPIRVDPGPFPPFTCRGCNTTKDLADMHVEDFSGRLYICRQCASNLGRVFGIVEGERMEELLSADRRLKQAEAELAERDEQITVLREYVTTKDTSVDELRAERDQLAGRVAQLEETVRTRAQEELQLVGADAVPPYQLTSTTATSDYFGEEQHNDGSQENSSEEEGTSPQESAAPPDPED